MEKYTKPCLAPQSNMRGIIPLAAVAGMSTSALAGIASVAGLAVGMAASSSRGSNDIVSFRAGLVLQEV